MNKKLPKVVIITPYYNRADAVQGTIKSLLAQDYPNLEIIAFNDGSTDNTLAELQKFEGSPRFKLIDHPNMGLYPALNHAIAQTDAAWIAIHGSGDIAYPDRVSKQIAFTQAHPNCVLVGCSHEIIDPVYPDLPPVPRINQGYISPRDTYLGKLFTHGTAMFERKAFDQIGGYITNIKWAADGVLFYMLARVGEVYAMPDICYLRYTRQDGVSFNISKAFERIWSLRFARSIIYKMNKRESVVGCKFPQTWEEIQAMYPRKSIAVQCGILSMLFMKLRIYRSADYDFYLDEMKKGGLYSWVMRGLCVPAVRLIRNNTPDRPASFLLRTYLCCLNIINRTASFYGYRFNNKAIVQ